MNNAQTVGSARRNNKESDGRVGKRKRANPRLAGVRCISGWSAIMYWRVPFIDAHFDLSTLVGPKEHITVFNYADRYQNKKHQVHYCKLRVPPKYVIYDPKREVHVASPELAFLQVAQDLDILGAILLAILLCAFPDGLFSQPLTTLKKLLDCAQRMSGHRGRRRALRALRYAAEGCNSPREAVVFMLLSLPNALGGLNLRGLRFNHKIVLRRADGGSGVFYGDFVLPSERLVIEYDGITHHGSKEAQIADSRRALRLSRENFAVVSMTTLHAENPSDFELFARDLLYRRLGRRIRIRARGFWKLRHTLQDMLMDSALPEWEMRKAQGDPDRYLGYYDRRDSRREVERIQVMNLFDGPRRWGLDTWPWNRSALHFLEREERQRRAEGRRAGERRYARSFPVRQIASELRARGATPIYGRALC
ncbi:MAG: hypothetical protein GX907_05670 [Clostridiaceae bacterium]|nr:hypothetical protein [Clostridiaceae bacterium]